MAAEGQRIALERDHLSDWLVVMGEF